MAPYLIAAVAVFLVCGFWDIPQVRSYAAVMGGIAGIGVTGSGCPAACTTCHPRLSNCGLDVEKMDTTYANPASKHNVHWVKCVDCHTHGVPKPKVQRTAALAAGQ